MADFKLVLADPKTGKCYQREAKDAAAKHFVGLKIGEKVRGEVVDLTGYEFEITGGSDHAGFPMRRDIEGIGRKRVLAVSGVGMKAKDKGIRQKKTMAGNTIHDKTAQINLKILKHGSTPLGEAKEGEKKEEKSTEKPKEEKK